MSTLLQLLNKTRSFSKCSNLNIYIKHYCIFGKLVQNNLYNLLIKVKNKIKVSII